METGYSHYQTEIPTGWLRCWAWAKDLLSTRHSFPMQSVLVGLGTFAEWCIVMPAINEKERFGKCLSIWDAGIRSTQYECLDKTWHLNKKEQEVTQQFEDSVGFIAQSQEPGASRDAWEDPPWSPRGPMLYRLALCRCFKCPERVCIVNIHWTM